MPQSAAATKQPVLEMKNVVRRYTQGEGAYLDVLRGVNLTVGAGEIVALVGPSGSGKSTLLHQAGILENPDGGSVSVGGQNVSKLDDGGRTQIRREKLGFIYQFHHLLPEFSALENVMMPMIIAGQPKELVMARATDLLRDVGLGERLEHRPSQLSGGEQQRVAIARALANNPLLILADEPTGNLDMETAERVFGVLMDVVREKGVGMLIATHNPDLAARMDRILTLDSGTVTSATPKKTPRKNPVKKKPAPKKKTSD